MDDLGVLVKEHAIWFQMGQVKTGDTSGVNHLVHPRLPVRWQVGSDQPKQLRPDCVVGSSDGVCHCPTGKYSAGEVIEAAAQGAVW